MKVFLFSLLFLGTMIGLTPMEGKAQSPSTAHDHCKEVKALIPRQTIQALAQADKIQDFRESTKEILDIAQRPRSGVVAAFVLRNGEGVIAYQIVATSDRRCAIETMIMYPDHRRNVP